MNPSEKRRPATRADPQIETEAKLAAIDAPAPGMQQK
jgi:hypothetical protein